MSLTILISLAILLWLSGRSGLRGLCVCVVVSGGDDVTVWTVCEFVCVLTDWGTLIEISVSLTALVLPLLLLLFIIVVCCWTIVVLCWTNVGPFDCGVCNDCGTTSVLYIWPMGLIWPFPLTMNCWLALFGDKKLLFWTTPCGVIKLHGAIFWICRSVSEVIIKPAGTSNCWPIKFNGCKMVWPFWSRICCCYEGKKNKSIKLMI